MVASHFITLPAEPVEIMRHERVAQIASRQRTASPVRGFDDSDWPLVVATFGAALPLPHDNDDHLVALLDCISGAHLRGPFALVFDLCGAPSFSAGRRRLLAAARAADERHFPGVMSACAIVVGDAEMQRAMVAVGWLQPTQHRVELFTKRADALLWACASVVSPEASRCSAGDCA